MIEVTNNVFSTGRVRPNFFGQSRARTMSRGLMGLGALPLGATRLQFKNDAAARDFIHGYGGQGGCDGRGGVWTGVAQLLVQVNDRIGVLQEAGADLGAWMSKAASRVAAVDAAQVHDEGITHEAFWNPIETIKQATRCGRSDRQEMAYKAAMQDLRYHLQALLSIPVPQVPLDVGSGSKGSAMTGSKGSALGGIPTWAKALGGVVLLGGVTYAFMRMGRK